MEGPAFRGRAYSFSASLRSRFAAASKRSEAQADTVIPAVSAASLIMASCSGVRRIRRNFDLRFSSGFGFRPAATPRMYPNVSRKQGADPLRPSISGVH